MSGHVRGVLAFLPPSPSLRWGWPLAMGPEGVNPEPPPGSGLGAGVLWGEVGTPRGPLGLVRDVGGQQPRRFRPRAVTLCAASPLLAPINGFRGAGRAGRRQRGARARVCCVDAAPRAQECGGTGWEPVRVTPVGVGPATAEATPGDPHRSLRWVPSGHPLGCSQQRAEWVFFFFLLLWLSPVGVRAH